MLRSVPDLLTTRPFSRVFSNMSAVALVAGVLALAVGHKFDRQHQTMAAHIANDLEFLVKAFQHRFDPAPTLRELACRPSSSITFSTARPAAQEMGLAP